MAVLGTEQDFSRHITPLSLALGERFALCDKMQTVHYNPQDKSVYCTAKISAGRRNTSCRCKPRRKELPAEISSQIQDAASLFASEVFYLTMLLEMISVSESQAVPCENAFIGKYIQCPCESPSLSFPFQGYVYSAQYFLDILPLEGAELPDTSGKSRSH